MLPTLFSSIVPSLALVGPLVGLLVAFHLVGARHCYVIACSQPFFPTIKMHYGALTYIYHHISSQAQKQQRAKEEANKAKAEALLALQHQSEVDAKAAEFEAAQFKVFQSSAEAWVAEVLPPARVHLHEALSYLKKGQEAQDQKISDCSKRSMLYTSGAKAGEAT